MSMKDQNSTTNPICEGKGSRNLENDICCIFGVACNNLVLS